MMKPLFFLIAVANIALFLWHYKMGAFNPLAKTTQQAVLENGEKMLLVSELPPAPATAIKTEPANQTIKPSATNSVLKEITVSEKNTRVEQEPADHCYEIGPFATQKIYNSWLAETKAIKKTIKQLHKTQQTVTHYLVYYPIAGTATSPQAATQLLNSHGVTDLYVLRNGEHKGQLSLGVFSTEERAINLQRAMQAKGLRVDIKPRYKTTAQHSIFVKTSVTLSEHTSILKKTTPELSIKAISNISKGCK